MCLIFPVLPLFFPNAVIEGCIFQALFVDILPILMEAWPTSTAAARPPYHHLVFYPSTQTYPLSTFLAQRYSATSIYTPCRMLESRYGRKWRGFAWSYWEKFVKRPTIANLLVLIDRYHQKSALTFPPTLIKQTMVELAMVTLDRHVPRLSNDDVERAFSVILTGNAAELPQHPSFVFVPEKPITSDQLQPACIQDTKIAIGRFLQTVNRQSWYLDEECLPYLPAQPISGGRIIDSDPTLQSLLGPSSKPGISLLKVEVQLNSMGYEKFVFSKSGRSFPFRGRGPVWKPNTCAVDCVIVAARLLNLGRIVADKGEETRTDWMKTLSPLTHDFLKVVSQPWEGLDDATSYGHRKKFLETFLTHFNDPNNPHPAGVQDFLPAIALWNLSTSGIMQTSFSTFAYSPCVQCKNDAAAVSHHQSVFLDKVEIAGSLWKPGRMPNMETLLNQYFDRRKRKCRHSRGVRPYRRAVYGNLPPRLAVLPDEDYRDVYRATYPEINIRYSQKTGPTSIPVRSIATYRWLGGIYRRANHYRVYWNEHGAHKGYRQPGEGTLMVYDGMDLHGSIIGGVPDRLPAKVPTEWSQGTDILFYERVETSPSALQYAAEAIKRGVDQSLQELLHALQTAQSDPLASVQGDDDDDDAPPPERRGKKRQRSHTETAPNKKARLA